MYIVTGGSGFIGSALVWALNQRGIEDIIVVDEVRTPLKDKNLESLKYSEYIEKREFRKALKSGRFSNQKIDAILHMGACSSTTETDAAFLLDNNFNYTVDLAMFADAHSIRFIYASSAATYGDGSQGYDDNEDAIDSLHPLNLYGYSKQLYDQFAKKTGLLERSVGLKFTNVFGPNEWHKGDMRSLICKAYEQISETGKLQLFKSHIPQYADGEQMRDFIYIKDTVKMVLFFIDHPEINGLYNIGSGKAETWNTLANAIFKGMEITPKIEYIDMPEQLRDKYQYYTKAEMSKLTNAGYTFPPMRLEDAVIDYVKNHLIPDKHLSC
jgi:ADP-L-glycero-D-manno-heptose 6-epimerase